MGLLLAFTISGALQRFDDRRQLVLQEATAVTAAYDRLGLFDGPIARELQSQLKDYVRARVDLYRMRHDFLLWEGIEDFSREQQRQLIRHKNSLWNAAVAACPKSAYQPACSLALPSLNSVFEVARMRAGASEKHPPQIIYVMLSVLVSGVHFLLALACPRSPARTLGTLMCNCASENDGGVEARAIQNCPDGQITQKSVHPFAQKYSA